MTYNIWDGGLGRLPLVEEVVGAQAPDVVALQEVTHRAAAEGLAARLGMHYVHGDANSEFDVAWLSRRPADRAENHRLPELAKTLLEIELGGILLFATHLVHGRDAAAERIRLREIDTIAEVLARVAGPHVLVGDLNAVHPEDGIGEPDEPVEYVSREPVARLLEAGYVDAFRTTHPDERGWTYTARQPWVRLDHVLVAGLEVRSCDVVTSAPAPEASDHFAVVAELA